MPTPTGPDRLLRRVVRDGGGWTVLLTVVALIGAAAELALPASLGFAVDAAVGGTASWWPAVACALVAILLATDILGDVAAGYGAARATALLRRRLLRHLFACDVRTVRRYPVGDLVGRLVGQATDAGQAGTAVVFGVVALLPPVGSVVALTLIEPLLGLTLLGGLAVLAVLMRAFVTDASAAVTGYQRVLGAIAGRLLEALGGARTIAAAATVDQERDRVLSALPELRGYGLLGWRLLARASARTAAVGPLLQAAVVAVGGYALTAGWLTPGNWSPRCSTRPSAPDWARSWPRSTDWYARGRRPTGSPSPWPTRPAGTATSHCRPARVNCGCAGSACTARTGGRCCGVSTCWCRPAPRSLSSGVPASASRPWPPWRADCTTRTPVRCCWTGCRCTG